MPRGDGTGPAGLGPMTGRAAGYCAGYGVPGYANAWPGRGLLWLGKRLLGRWPQMVGALSLRPDASVSLSLCRTTRSTAGAGYLEAGSNRTSSRTRQYTETPRRNRRRKQSGLGSSRENTQSRGRVPPTSRIIKHAALYRTIVVPYTPLFASSLLSLVLAIKCLISVTSLAAGHI